VAVKGSSQYSAAARLKQGSQAFSPCVQVDSHVFFTFYNSACS